MITPTIAPLLHPRGQCSSNLTPSLICDGHLRWSKYCEVLVQYNHLDFTISRAKSEKHPWKATLLPKLNFVAGKSTLFTLDATVDELTHSSADNRSLMPQKRM